MDKQPDQRREQPRQEERSGQSGRRRQRNGHGAHGRSGNRPRSPQRQQKHSSAQQERGGSTPVISVVIPLYNEEGSLPELGKRLEEELVKLVGDRYEVIFVDDGSTDTSYEVLRRLHRQNHRFHAIRFRTNYGKAAALAIGFDRVRGQFVFTMDADLQDDPKELKDLLDKLKSGYDLVSGWKRERHDPWHKTLPSKFFNTVVQKVTGLDIHDFNCGLKVYRREVLSTLNVYGEMHRYLPAQAHWEGFRVTELPVQHHPRKHGVSKYGMSRLVKGFLDLLTLVLTTKYARRPLHVFGSVGVIIAAIGFLIDLWLSVEWFLGTTSLTNRPLALLGVLLT